MTATATTARKIHQAIAECDRFIAIEGGRAADLRPPNVQKTLDFYYEHRLALIAKLDAVVS